MPTERGREGGTEREQEGVELEGIVRLRERGGGCDGLCFVGIVLPTESDELIGSKSLVSRLPQYLITAMLTGAVQVIWSTASASRRTRFASDCIGRHGGRRGGGWGERGGHGRRRGGGGSTWDESIVKPQCYAS